MAENYYASDLDEDQVNARKTFGDSHQRLSVAADYPPFSIDAEMREEFLKKVREAGNADPDSDPHAPIVDEYTEQIEEAEMYQKRYGKEKFEAQKAAAELEKIEISDSKVARLSMDYDYGD